MLYFVWAVVQFLLVFILPITVRKTFDIYFLCANCDSVAFPMFCFR